MRNRTTSTEQTNKKQFYPEPISTPRGSEFHIKRKAPRPTSRRCNLYNTWCTLIRVTCRHLDQVTWGVTPPWPLSWRLLLRLVIIWPRPTEGSLQPVQAGWSSGDKFVVIIVLFINIFITIISVVTNHKGSWTRVLFHSLHLSKKPTQFTKYSAHIYCFIFARCYQCGDERVTESRVCLLFVGLGSAQAPVRGHHPSPPPAANSSARLISQLFLH